MKLVNLKRYTPDEFTHGEDVQYFIDETGKDWFQSLSSFKKKYALLIDSETGVIRGITSDASRLYPVGYTVVDIDSLPTGCDASGGWMFAKGKVSVWSQKSQDDAARLKRRLMQTATDKIAVLSDAQQLNMATDDEAKELEAWRKYRVLLSRIDTTAADIIWPEVP
ncbi:tail fiber assembly protein [Serratia ficaria]|uniref:tail fiber assembly protein n=1 Tax=Serratia ficaria TaxID=61651 RepID=UPI00217B7043|nr:tail fiber assembly protein [Serratia ficaria]CAI0759989.1 Caudovirales tail fibre assembly protein [Serratia ficaria]CAI1569687.1 Caudovirales tail fibre assembly protein [Serratia ficaria]CAI2405238.1 Caudovirales tail fibre assembly protein [Serratia ficaria]CAI2431451.1 Caudovirales tail fibre assembly protein [Serratia ficaria]CAI2499240.1 Caudovirales tail fibre assembly protein [Serratia ficaria]